MTLPPRLSSPLLGRFGLPRLAALAAVALLAACSDDATGDSGSAADSKGGKKPVPPEQLILETDVDPGETRAGQTFAVKCRTFEPGADEIEVPLPAPATLEIAGPDAPESANGTQVVFQKVGKYQIRCKVPQYNLADAVPAELEVVPGPGTVAGHHRCRHRGRSARDRAADRGQGRHTAANRLHRFGQVQESDYRGFYRHGNAQAGGRDQGSGGFAHRSG
jgi:hypothetical protein